MPIHPPVRGWPHEQGCQGLGWRSQTPSSGGGSAEWRVDGETMSHTNVWLMFVAGKQAGGNNNIRHQLAPDLTKLAHLMDSGLRSGCVECEKIQELSFLRA